MITQPVPRLTGRTLLFARLIWLAFAALAVGTYLAAVFIHANELQHVCLASVEECKQPGRLLITPDDVAHLQGEGVSLSLFATLETAKLLFFSSIWFIMGGLIFLRKSNEWMALLTAFFLVTFGTGFDGVFGALTSAYPAWWLPVKTVGYLSGLSSFLFLALFPNGRFVPRWARWLIILYGLVAIPEFFFPAAWLNSRQQYGWLLSAANLVIYGLLVLAQVYRYRRISTLSERQQTLWPVLGIIAGRGSSAACSSRCGCSTWR